MELFDWSAADEDEAGKAETTIWKNVLRLGGRAPRDCIVHAFSFLCRYLIKQRIGDLGPGLHGPVNALLDCVCLFGSVLAGAHH